MVDVVVEIVEKRGAWICEEVYVAREEGHFLRLSPRHASDFTVRDYAKHLRLDGVAAVDSAAGLYLHVT